MSPPQSAQALPHGTVTFLFTDIQGSTDLLQILGERYAELLADQRNILRIVFSRRNGQEVDTQGDSFFYAFLSAREAIAAAAEAQRALAAHTWPGGVQVRLRMGLHTGEPLEVTQEGYVGMDIHRAARIAHAGHGGQILLSETTTPLVTDDLPSGSILLDLGRHRLKDMRRPEHISQLSLDGLEDSFPPLKSLEVLPPLISYDYGPLQLPPFLEQSRLPSAPVFVGRTAELKRLDRYFESALAGNGRMAFVVGGPGRGKTALLKAFCREIGEQHPETLIGWGECTAHTGHGDPYLPFRYLFRTLTGDLESLLVSGKISQASALRVWECLPETARRITEMGSALMGLLLSGRDLLARVRLATKKGMPWIERLSALGEKGDEAKPAIEARLLMEQVEDVLTDLAMDHPLVLVLDDIQWADSASVDLLFHLSRRLAGRRILLLLAYRPEEVTIGRSEGFIHPLRPALTEFKRLYGEAWVDLGQTDEAENRMFVEDYLDSEPNELGTTFRNTLYQRTGGHALFTVELLRSMQERGDLTRDEHAKWKETEDLDWERLPARVEGVIEERFLRLPEDLKEILRVASIEGEIFTAQVVMKMLGLDERSLYGALGLLSREHRLVSEHEVLEQARGSLVRFAFRHTMFQEYIYHSIGEGERRRLHATIGEALETFYEADADDLAGILAYHFSQGGAREKALTYLLRAGDRARSVHAYPEAIADYQKALGFLEEQGTPETTARTLLKLGLIFNAQGGHTEANRIYDQAFELWEPLRSVWESETAERIRETLRLALDIPEQLDPGLISDDASSFIVRQLFEGLVAVDAENNVLPAVAARWEILDDGRRYRFHLRKGLLWSDGSPMTAEDFVLTWRRTLKLAQRSPNAQLLFVIKNARALAKGDLADEREIGLRSLDDHTLEITLETPIAYLPHLLALPIAYPLPSALAASDEPLDFSRHHPVSNGPYRLEVYAFGDRLVLQRNPHYRGYFPGNIQRVEGCPVRDYVSAFDQFERGDLDMVSMITSDPKTVRQARRRFGGELKFIPHPTTFFVTFCCERPPFDAAVVRQAFVHAVDREELVAGTSQGQYQPALGGFLPPGMPGHQPGIGLVHDPDKARELLAQVGFPEGKGFPQVELLFTGPDPHDPLIDFLCEAWERELGVVIQAKNSTWEEFIARRDVNPPHLSTMGYTADYPDPDAVLRVLFHSEQGFNPSRCKHTELDELVEEASRMLDTEKRMETYQRADRILVAEEAVVMPIGYSWGRLLQNPRVFVPEIPIGQMQLKEVNLLK